MVICPTTSKSVNHIAALCCDVSLIIIHVSGCFCFSDINISQGSVSMHLRFGSIFYYCLARNLLLSLSVKEFWKWVGKKGLSAWVLSRLYPYPKEQNRTEQNMGSHLTKLKRQNYRADVQMLWTRPSCILHRSTIDMTVVYKTVVYVLHTTAARWRHTPTKLLPLTSPNPNTNPNRTQTLTVINPTKP